LFQSFQPGTIPAACERAAKVRIDFNFSFLFKVNLGLMGKLLKDEKTNLK
jgi:hypothetical protein